MNRDGLWEIWNMETKYVDVCFVLKPPRIKRQLILRISRIRHFGLFRFRIHPERYVSLRYLVGLLGWHTGPLQILCLHRRIKYKTQNVVYLSVCRPGFEPTSRVFNGTRPYTSSNTRSLCSADPQVTLVHDR
jgi:hypothetical protein